MTSKNSPNIDELIKRYPELKLRKCTETYTVHRNDLAKFPTHKAGDVIKMTCYLNEHGKQWFDADIIYYAKMQDIINREMVAELDLDLYKCSMDSHQLVEEHT